jgi:DNA mismatch endonuclease (patch repair protein)
MAIVKNPPARRRNNMRAIRAKNTKPELIVRSLLHGLGYRFRLHQRGLPGSPDVVLARFRTVIFVHGCWWHGHSCAKGRSIPATNTSFWTAKLAANKSRDTRSAAALRRTGWHVLTVWECETRSVDTLRERLAGKLTARSNSL